MRGGRAARKGDAPLFGLFHLLTLFLSALLWTLLAAWNTRAAALGLGPLAIGGFNGGAYVVYVASALLIARRTDRWGSKRPLAAALFLFAAALPTGLLWNGKGLGWMALTAGLTTLFYGFYYPCVEGLLSRAEAREGADPAGTTARFSLSWSAGNILGMASGPWLIQCHPAWIFVGGSTVCVGAGAAALVHAARYGERLPGAYRAPAPRPAGGSPNRRGLRTAARASLFLACLAFFGTMFLYPKVLWTEGVGASRIGPYAACGNLTVFLLFLSLSGSRFWIGRPVWTAALCSGALSLFAAAFLLPAGSLAYALLPALGGLAYAVPYAFALYYGLDTPDGDHAGQGALHETLIGLGLGLGPLISGGLMEATGAWRSLGGLAALLAALSLILHLGLARAGGRCAVPAKD